MKKIQSLIGLLIAGLLSMPNKLMAQDQGNYTESLGVQDSSYLKQDLMVDGAAGSGTGTTIIIIVVVIVILGAVLFYLKKNKKKQA